MAVEIAQRMEAVLTDTSKETIKGTKIPGVYVVERPTFGDDRGFFHETYRMSELSEVLGFEPKFVQQNHSFNTDRNTVRGIHVAPWNKFVYATNGRVLQVIVDCRIGSPTFGEVLTLEIGDERRAKVFVPAGCGNGYRTLDPNVNYMYDVDDYWYPGSEEGVSWDDSSIRIPWGLEGSSPVLSPKDSQNGSFEDLKNKNKFHFSPSTSK